MSKQSIIHTVLPLQDGLVSVKHFKIPEFTKSTIANTRTFSVLTRVHVINLFAKESNHKVSLWTEEMKEEAEPQ